MRKFPLVLCDADRIDDCFGLICNRRAVGQTSASIKITNVTPTRTIAQSPTSRPRADAQSSRTARPWSPVPICWKQSGSSSAPPSFLYPLPRESRTHA